MTLEIHDYIQPGRTAHLVGIGGVSMSPLAEVLHGAGVPMEQKPFAIGVRIEQDQAAVSQAQYGRSIGHYQTHIPSSGQFIGFLNILLDLQTRLCHTRRISQRQVILCSNRNCCNNLDLTFPFLMKSQ